MSDMERHSGIAVLIERLPGETLEEQCRRIGNCELQEFYDSYAEQLLDNHYGEYIIVDGNLYKLDDTEYEYSENFCTIEKIDDINFKYTAQFYNGGTCLTEILEDELKGTVKND